MYLMNPLLQKKLYKLQEKGKIMDKERDPTTYVLLEDTQHVAFLKMLGHRVVPWIESPTAGQPPVDPNSRRVQFQVYGDPKVIELDMQKYYDDIPYPIQSFCRHLKDIKSAMYNLRRMKES